MLPPKRAVRRLGPIRCHAHDAGLFTGSDGAECTLFDLTKRVAACELRSPSRTSSSPPSRARSLLCSALATLSSGTGGCSCVGCKPREAPWLLWAQELVAASILASVSPLPRLLRTDLDEPIVQPRLLSPWHSLRGDTGAQHASGRYGSAASSVSRAGTRLSCVSDPFDSLCGVLLNRLPASHHSARATTTWRVRRLVWTGRLRLGCVLVRLWGAR